MSLDLQPISVLINDTRKLMVKEDRRQAGSDLAVTLHQCEHALGLCQTEIERLHAELAECEKECTGLRHEVANDNLGHFARAEAATKEATRLRAELDEAKAEPPRPAAIMANSDGDIQAYEDMQDYLATRQPRGSWGYAVRSWTWHPKSP